MSVQYSVVFKDGKRFKNSAVCFGVLGDGRWDEQRPSYTTPGSSASELTRRPGSDHSFIEFDSSFNIHPTWVHGPDNYTSRGWDSSGSSNSNSETRKTANRNYLYAMKDLVDDLPMLHGMVTIHPLIGGIRVHIKDHTADEVMMALYLFRNLCHYDQYACIYKYLLTLGYRPRFAAIVCHLFYGRVTPGTFGRQPVVQFKNNSVGEYNWVSPDTMGRQGFLNMMSQDLDSFSWKQHKWKDGWGYHREGYFKRNNIWFDERYEGYMWDFDNNRRDVSREQANYGNSVPVCPRKYWHILDALSVPGDVPILDGLQTWNPVLGFKWHLEMARNNIGTDYSFSTEQTANILEGLSALCEMNGINPRIN